MTAPKRAAALRRSVPIHAYVGPNGGGKSFCAVYDSLLSLDRDRPVLSTVPLYDASSPLIERRDPITDAVRYVPELLHPGYVPLTSWRQLMDIRHCDVLLDEVTGVASSRSFASLPPQLGNLFMQLRRGDVTVRWTSPNFARADVLIREVTQYVTVCRGFLPKAAQGSEWPEKRWFVWDTYDGQQFDEFEAQRTDDLNRTCRQTFHRLPDCRVAHTYDTLEAVSMLDHISDLGACMSCGGNRPRPKCTCEKPAVQAARQLRQDVH